MPTLEKASFSMEQLVRGAVHIQPSLISYQEADDLFLCVHIPYLNVASVFVNTAQWHGVGCKVFSSTEVQ